VEAGDGVIPRHGFYQPRVPVRADAEYRGYLWLKADGYTGRVTVALESDADAGEVYASADISNVAGDWRKHEFTLRPTRTDPLARLCVLFYGRGRVWVDQLSLMPADAAPGGVRREVFEKIKALRPAFVRWPGGNRMELSETETAEDLRRCLKLLRDVRANLELALNQGKIASFRLAEEEKRRTNPLRHLFR